MSLTNPNKVVTEERLSEFYQGIFPYLGGMPDVLANKFSKGDLYSTDEKMIGQWIDGKPIYQKTIDIGNLPSSATSTDYNHNIVDVDKVLSIRGVGVSSSNAFIFFPSTGANENHSGDVGAYATRTVVNLRTYDDRSSYHGYIIIQYTKTTDSPISIGSDTDYSTTEKIVGTWIDGKPLYQITIVSSITARNTWCDTGFSTLNKHIHGLIGVDVLPIDVILPPVGAPVMHKNGVVEVYNAMAVEIQSNELMIRYDRQSDSSPTYPFNFTFTIQYTKTTD